MVGQDEACRSINGGGAEMNECFVLLGCLCHGRRYAPRVHPLKPCIPVRWDSWKAFLPSGDITLLLLWLFLLRYGTACLEGGFHPGGIDPCRRPAFWLALAKEGVSSLTWNVGSEFTLQNLKCCALVECPQRCALSLASKIALIYDPRGLWKSSPCNTQRCSGEWGLVFLKSRPRGGAGLVHVVPNT